MIKNGGSNSLLNMDNIQLLVKKGSFYDPARKVDVAIWLLLKALIDTQIMRLIDAHILRLIDTHIMRLIDTHIMRLKYIDQ